MTIYNKTYAIETGKESEQLSISGIRVDYGECKNGNPYNTVFFVEVVSGHFSGFSTFEYDIKEFVQFIYEIKELYDFKRKLVELDDICYGSKIQFSLNNLGHVCVSGILYGDAMIHSLKFEFDTDQTAFGSFCDALYRDFVTESNPAV
ncbi:MAG: hypothetical protein FWD84_04050 [Oscillospiraceae bacterium]|nr:hypothetical protein [Oscillospiraceae bacterium]